MARLPLAIALLALSAAAAPIPYGQASGDHVVLISIDGFAAFHLDNQAIDLPNIRALADSGVRASSETVFPSMTHPAHTSLITGVPPRQHGVVDNRVVDRRTGERFHITNLPRRESVKVPTLFDAVRARGRRTAALFWPETRTDASIDDNVAEVFGRNEMADPTAVAPGLMSELRDAGVPIDSYYHFYDDPFTQGASDIALTQAAVYLLKARRPGLLALHLLVADKVQHEVGPDHYLAHAALTTADRCVGLIRKAVSEAGMAERTTIVVAADHGFATVRDEVNLTPALDHPDLKERVRWKADGWYVWGELLPAFDSDRDGPILEAALDRASRVPGVARVVRPGGFAALGYPDYSQNVYVPGHYLIAGDVDTHLTLDAEAPQVTRRPRARPYHGHGYFPGHPKMHAALVLSGAGVAQGRRIGQVRNIDVAPTLARLLGLELPSATGRVLHEALRQEIR